MTLVREYAQGELHSCPCRRTLSVTGPNALVYTLPAGLYDRKKHSSVQDCAASELSEEARLTGGEWVRLLPEGHNGISELKWCTNRFVPFLVIDPTRDRDPLPRDDEEFIRVQEHVPLARLKELILRCVVRQLSKLALTRRSGELMLPSVQTTMMALEALRKRGVKLEGW